MTVSNPLPFSPPPPRLRKRIMNYSRGEAPEWKHPWGFSGSVSLIPAQYLFLPYLVSLMILMERLSTDGPDGWKSTEPSSHRWKTWRVNEQRRKGGRKKERERNGSRKIKNEERSRGESWTIRSTLSVVARRSIVTIQGGVKNHFLK